MLLVRMLLDSWPVVESREDDTLSAMCLAIQSNEKCPFAVNVQLPRIIAYSL